MNFAACDFSLGDLLYEHKAPANAQEIVMPGLDGDRDGGYIVRGAVHLLAASGGAVYSLRPQGLTTDQTGRWIVEGGGYATVALLQIIGPVNLTPGPIYMDFTTLIEAQRTIGGVASWRRFRTITKLHHNQISPYQLSYEATGNWRETATNLTSLTLYSSVAGSILAGSCLQVFRTARKFPA